jgi:Fe-S-cluster containining protein
MVGKVIKVTNGYNCNKCTAYCCSYDHIAVSSGDLRRLAGHFELSEAAVKDRFTKVVEDGDRVLRHQKDHFFKSVCVFLDKEKRACTIYEARPSVCRVYPYGSRCGYYDFLRFERKHAEDETFVP